MGKGYSNNSISSLKDEQQVRQRPAVIFGTNDVYGCAHGVFEIIANSVDEAREGYGNLIEIDVKQDGTVRVRDNGRGVPMDWNESEERFNWQLVYCTMYASGKYDSENYSTSLGLNGLGATATQYASEFMKVVSVRDGKRYTMNFKVGKPVGEMLVEPFPSSETGTDIIFKPDREVFTDINIPAEYYVDKLRRTAMLHPKLKIELRIEGKNDITLYYPEGIKGFLDIVCEKQMINSPIYFSGEDTGTDDEADEDFYKVSMEVAFTFSRETNLVELYHNGGFMSDGGVTSDAMWAAILKVIEEAAKQAGKLGKSERLSTKDIEEILVAIGSTNCPGHRTYFKNQTKTAINNPFIKKAYYSFIYYNFNRWVTENKAQADRIIAEAIANKEARESAEAVKKKALSKLTAGIDKLGNKPAKFVECATKNPLAREVYIVEGDSAAGSVKLARNGEFQAIMPVRGKIMNCLKESIERILNSDIILDLLRVVGCGIEIQSKNIKDLPKFDIARLNWGKVIICTDADTDGMQIRCLILTLFYRLMPTLLKKGKVFIAETPLFEITAKDETHFAYTEAEKEKICKQLETMGYRKNQIVVQRSKGLGENDPKMMAISTMNPNTRRLIPVEYPENEEGLAEVFNALLGDDIESRRYMIDEYFDMEVDID